MIIEKIAQVNINWIRRVLLIVGATLFLIVGLFITLAEFIFKVAKFAYQILLNHISDVKNDIKPILATIKQIW